MVEESGLESSEDIVIGFSQIGGGIGLAEFKYGVYEGLFRPEMGIGCCLRMDSRSRRIRLWLFVLLFESRMWIILCLLRWLVLGWETVLRGGAGCSDSGYSGGSYD